ncbi:Dihydropteroate synthase [Sinobacterium norvegicum]|uniref:Dihydropteroate synthase n=1 Tax=Sinobacterium norvegicum TaxID=1641715 RepID=A0ABN8EM49_9GAMM|nr:dihydropteroate synthase [Sinobacterium norvegicum]CAH0992235.1 Dihydropteroate synthase [Sinobacterium norvegicum]
MPAFYCGEELLCGDKTLSLTATRLMGVLNVTPDSFSDGGRNHGFDQALSCAEAMLAAGVDIIDVGGESTRPGAEAVSLDQELDRVVPVVEAIKQRLDVIVSVDTSSAAVMTEAAAAGAGLINDVRALQREGAMAAAAASGLPVCLMHMQGQPVTMQQAPSYRDVQQEVEEFLLQRVAECHRAGIGSDKLLLDPGFGFGKTVEHNIKLFSQLDKIGGLSYPLLIGVSRKSMIGAVTGKDVEQRLSGSLAFAVLAALQGAAIVRVHDVDETMDVLKVVNAVAAAR